MDYLPRLNNPDSFRIHVCPGELVACITLLHAEDEKVMVGKEGVLFDEAEPVGLHLA